MNYPAYVPYSAPVCYLCQRKAENAVEHPSLGVIPLCRECAHFLAQPKPKSADELLAEYCERQRDAIGRGYEHDDAPEVQ